VSLPTLEPLHGHPTPHPPSDACPHVSPALTLTESEEEKHAESMTDAELVFRVESKLRPVGEELRSLVPYLREARARFAHPGRRVPVPGEPTFGEWIRQNIGISGRHVRRLLAAAKEPADRSREDELESPKQQRRDEAMWQASRLAHAVLGLDEPDERDPAGHQRKAALAALAHEFLNLSGRKHIPVLVRLRQLQPGDFRGLYAILAQCLDSQMGQVFGSLDEHERSEAVRLFAQEIANRYHEPRLTEDASLTPEALFRKSAAESCGGSLQLER
jgi:hypothetical protein